MKGPAERIADAVLYEGYILYPYRISALKNRSRWNFGGLCPRAYSESQCGTERWRTQTECLIEGDAQTTVQIKIRCLHVVNRQVARVRGNAAVQECESDGYEFVDTLEVGGRVFQTWQEAKKRKIELPEVALEENGDQEEAAFHLQEWRNVEPLHGSTGRLEGALIRMQEAIDGVASVMVTRLEASLFKIRLEISNLTEFAEAKTASRERAMMHSLVSTHAILNVTNGQFVSLLDPPAKYADSAAECQNTHLYPVLVGSEDSRSTILASPIILYDYPNVAPESTGDLFDGAEIEEILTLRILALSEKEKEEMRQCDERAREILERVESDPEHLAALHGAMRAVETVDKTMPPDDWTLFEQKPRLKSVSVPGGELCAGDHVRVRPRKTADILDLALAGRAAVIESIEVDYEGQIHLAVILDDDPGRDLGEMRQPGHRFFFAPEEVELTSQIEGT